MSKMSKWDKFGPKIIIFESYDEVYQIVDIKIWFKVAVLDFKKNSCYTQGGRNGSFLGKKSYLKCFLNLSLGFSKFIPYDRH